MKKIGTLALGIALLIAAAVPAHAAALTAEEAKTLAGKAVPTGSTHLWTENDGSRFEVKFYNEDRLERYEIDVSKAGKAVVSFESKRDNHLGSTSVTLTETDAKGKVTGEISGAEILSVRLDTDDSLYEYEVRFKTDGYYGEYTIHPENGRILEREIRVGTAPASTDVSELISYDKAWELALAQVPGGTITDLDLDRESGAYFYEVELVKDGVEYEIGLDASTGELLWKEQENWDGDGRDNDDKKYESSGSGSNQGSSAGYIGVERAKQIALAQVPGASVRKCKLDHDDGHAVYEGELYKDGWEYEFEIDAVTGSILEWDVDEDD